MATGFKFSPRCDASTKCCGTVVKCQWTWDAGMNGTNIYAQYNDKPVISVFNPNAPFAPGHDPENLSFEWPGGYQHIYFNSLLLHGPATLRVWCAGEFDPATHPSFPNIASVAYSANGTDTICVNGITYLAGTGSPSTPMVLVEGVNFVHSNDDQSAFEGGDIYEFSCGECEEMEEDFFDGG